MWHVKNTLFLTEAIMSSHESSLQPEQLLRSKKDVQYDSMTEIVTQR